MIGSTSNLDRKKEILAGIFLLAMTFANLVTLPELIPLLRSGYQNFTSFYTAGELVRNGRTSDLYNLSTQYEVQKRIAPDVRIRQAALPFYHPPVESLLFVPLTVLPYWTAYLLWTALNLTMLGTVLWIVRRSFAATKNLSPMVVALTATGFFPVVTAIVQGQDCILLLFLFVLAMVAFEKENDVAAGALLAGGLFRFQLVLPLILILAFRRWRLLLGFMPVAAVLGAISLAMVGWSGAFEYIHFVLNLERSGAGGSIVAVGMPNLHGIIAGLPGISSRPTLLLVLTAVSSFAAILITVGQTRMLQPSKRFVFTLATLTAILVSYHALKYDLSLLLPALLLFLAEPGRGTTWETRRDILLLLFLFLVPRFDLLGPWLGWLGWFAAFIGWLYWNRNSTRREFVPTSVTDTLVDADVGTASL